MPTPRSGSFDDLLAWGSGMLANGGIADARREARLLLGHIGKLTTEDMLAGRVAGLGDDVTQAYGASIERRVSGEPVSRIRGFREFWSLNFEISPATLDPRPDSEHVVEAVVKRLRERAIAAPRLLDLGTGTGCLLISAVSEISGATGVGVDLSAEAIHTARRNAARLGMADRTRFLVGNWAATISAQFDAVIVNPPYIVSRTIDELAVEVRDFDPKLALDGGYDGLACYRDLAPQLRRLVGESGLVAIEIGIAQSTSVTSILAAQGLEVVEVVPDLAGIPRCIIGMPGPG